MSFDLNFVPPPAAPVSGSYLSGVSSSRNMPKSDLRFGATQFLTIGKSAEDRFEAKDGFYTPTLGVGKPKVDPTPLSIVGQDQSGKAASNGLVVGLADQDVRKISEHRIRLLAVKYARESISSEMIARLEILNSRLSERAPRITAQQISSLESAISSVKAIESSRLARAARLGLKI